jgi:hypothetical protein
MLSLEERKNKKYYKVHNSLTHSTNECRIFRQQIQKAIELGRLTFDKPNKATMKIDENPFASQNMVNVVLPKAKAKVLNWSS